MTGTGVIAAALLALATCLVVLGLAWPRLRRRRAGVPRTEPIDPTLAALEERIGYRFGTPSTLETAVTHSSFANESGGEIRHNETLEFLGDAVIELISTRILFEHGRDMREGEMSKLRAMVVSKPSLSEMAEHIDLGAALKLSVGEFQSGGRRKASLLANAYEAIAGAVFLDGGFDRAYETFAPAFRVRIDDALSGRLDTKDHKTRLQEVCQARFGDPPNYHVVAESGPDHDKRFESELCADGGRLVCRGQGRSKKESEQDAARQALADLGDDDA